MKNEDFVTYEQSVKLKELGFDWKVTHFYVDKSNYRNKPFLYCNGEYIEMLGGLGGSVLIEDLIKDNNNVNDDFSAPTLAQAQKWLREIKGVEVNACAYLVNEWNGEWFWFYNKLEPDPTVNTSYNDEFYSSYEQALSAGIDKALELLKEK